MRLQQTDGGAGRSWLGSHRFLTALALVAAAAFFGAMVLISGPTVTEGVAANSGPDQVAQVSKKKRANRKFKKRFKKQFNRVRILALKGSRGKCRIGKAAKLNRKIRWGKAAPLLKQNPKWKNGPSRWMTFYPRAVIAMEKGNRKQAQGLATRGVKQYIRIESAGRKVRGPGSKPKATQMGITLSNIVWGRYRRCR